MGTTNSIHKVGFATVQRNIGRTDSILVNTLPLERQDCLIKGTISANTEVALINMLLKKSTNTCITVYGENAADDSACKKCCQLSGLGFKDVKVYAGGLFEWLLLQDIYGTDNFPTTSQQLDILRYAGTQDQQTTSFALVNT